MMIGRSRDLAEQLDAALDGHQDELPDALAPLLAAADTLRGEFERFELDPDVSEKHLNHVYRRARSDRAATTLGSRFNWRNRVISIGFAVVLLAVPAGFASADAKPGDALYPLKLGIERIRLMGAMSPSAKAEERTRIAQVRLEELQGLLQAGEFGRIPEALAALQAAMRDAERALASARRQGADSTVIAALESRLHGLDQARSQALVRTLQSLPEARRRELLKAINSTPRSASATAPTRHPPGSASSPGPGSGPGATTSTGAGCGGSGQYCGEGGTTGSTGAPTTTTEEPPVIFSSSSTTTSSTEPPPTTTTVADPEPTSTPDAQTSSSGG